eukprot:1332049-Amorphochlora_amoeboformis.AAC.1
MSGKETHAHPVVIFFDFSNIVRNLDDDIAIRARKICYSNVKRRQGGLGRYRGRPGDKVTPI